MPKEIRFIKKCDEGKINQIKNYSNSSAKSLVEQGYAEYVEEKKAVSKTTKELKSKEKETIKVSNVPIQDRIITYSKGCFEKKNLLHLSLKEIISKIKEDDLLRVNTILIREAETKNERSELKKKFLPVVNFQGQFSYLDGKGFEKHSGLAVIDIDVYKGIDHSLEIKEEVIKEDHVVFCFMSPSGGLKVGCRIPEVESEEEYKEYYLALIDHYMNYSVETDTKTKDIARLCFLAYDEDAYTNYDAVEYTKKKEIVKKVSKTDVGEIKTGSEDIREAISYLKPDDRDLWIQVCCALKSEKKDYFNLFNEWSSQGESYQGEEDCRKTWESFDERDEGIKIGTLFFHAKKNGYKPKYKFKLDLVDMSIENQAIEIINKNPLFYDNFKKWWAFDNDKKYWLNVDETDIISFIKKSFNLFGLSESKKRTEILNALKDEARYRKPLEVKDTQIQIGKFIYDIASDDIIESSPKYKSKFYLAHDIDEIEIDEECPHIDKLFEDWKNEDKEDLYEICAFMISPSYFIDVCFWFVGSGENGKGLFQNILIKLVGAGNVTAQDIELLSDPKDRFTKLFLKDKLVCMLGDGNQQSLEYSKALKTLSGGTDLIRGEIKGSGSVSFFNTAKILGSYNTLPATNDKTDGFYRRQYIAEFKNNFAGKINPLPNVPEREYTILCAKSLIRLKEMYVRQPKRIKNWGSLNDRREKYERLSNPLGKFMDDEMVFDYDGCFAPHSFEKRYRMWAIQNGFNQFTKKELEARLENLIGKKTKKWVYVSAEGDCYLKEEDIPKGKESLGLKQWRVYLGYKFKEFVTKVTNVTPFSVDALYKASDSKTGHKSHICHKDVENAILECKNTLYLMIDSGVEIKKSLFDNQPNQEIYQELLNKMLKEGILMEIKPEIYVGVLK